MIRKSIGDLVCPSFGGVYIDLLQFYKNLLGNVCDLKLPLMHDQTLKCCFRVVYLSFLILLGQIRWVVISVRQADLRVDFDSRGVDASYNRLFWTTEINGWWLHVLEAYVAK